MPKATQAGHGNLEQKRPTVEPIVRKSCHVCGTPSLPWGYIKHGAAHVCCSTCHNVYQEKRYERV